MNSSIPGSSVSQPLPRFRRMRRVIIGLAVIGTLLALFYAVEDWRGRAAWEKCKLELDAKGLPMDWAKYIPSATIADADNFFKAPKMQEWFVRKETNHQFTWGIPDVGGSNPVMVAEVTVILPGVAEKAGHVDGVFRLDDPATARQTEKLVLDAVGPHVCGAQGFVFVARPAENIKPLRIILRTDKMPSREELAALFPETTLAGDYFVPRVSSGLKVRAKGSNSFRVMLDPAPASAAAFVAATDNKKDDIDLLRAALKRPYARAEGNYASPTTQPAPNFVQVRIVAQFFSERAQCHLMLGQPAEALEDLTMIHDLCRMLEGRPSGPTTLVGPMINVAVRGLYSLTIADGIRLGAWREPQLVTLEAQLQQVDLRTQVRAGFREAGAALCHYLATFNAVQYARSAWASKHNGVPEGFWDYASDGNFWRFALMPRGWRYQNMVRSARAHEIMDEEFNVADGMLDPGKAGEISRYLGSLRGGPYTYFVLRFLPNYMRAGMVTGYQQTMANEALIACALERYHLAEGKYPATLDVLAPQYLDKIPRDIIGGKPLIYHRTDDGKFMLYSVGWDQKDDGGTPSRSAAGITEWEKGDWVWLNSRP